MRTWDTAISFGLNTWIRRPQVTTWPARLFAACAVGFVALAVWFFVVGFGLVAGASGKSAQRGDALAVVAIMLGYALVSAIEARQYARRGLLLSSDGIVIRNLRGTKRVSLANAHAFSPGVPTGMSGPQPMLKLQQGADIGVGSLARNAARWRYERHLRELEPTCEELNRILVELQHNPATRPSPLSA